MSAEDWEALQIAWMSFWGLMLFAMLGIMIWGWFQ